jgi:hypothetical protein
MFLSLPKEMSRSIIDYYPTYRSHAQGSRGFSRHDFLRLFESQQNKKYSIQQDFWKVDPNYWSQLALRASPMQSLLHDGRNAEVRRCQRNPEVDFEIELTQCSSKMALCRRLRALHTLAAHAMGPVDEWTSFGVQPPRHSRGLGSAVEDLWQEPESPFGQNSALS